MRSRRSRSCAGLRTVGVGLGVGDHPTHDRADGAPGDPQQVTDRELRAMRHQPGGGVIEGVGVPGAVPRPRHPGGNDPMLGAPHPRRVGLQKRLERAQIQRPPTASTLHPGHSRGTASRSVRSGVWSLSGVAPTPRRLARPRRTRRLPPRPCSARAAEPISLQNARRSPPSSIPALDSRNRRRGTACGASRVSQPPTEGSQEPPFGRRGTSR